MVNVRAIVCLEQEELDKATGLPRYIRRLTDKVLSAFNHAYAVGELEAAERLRDTLSLLELNAGPGGNKRASSDMLGQAELWVGFVEARNHYRAVCERDGREDAEFEDALTAMKVAYQRWSLA